MSNEEFSKEERILRMMKKVLTDVAKDTYTRPGFKHQLSDETIGGIRECLKLISSREIELAEASGRPMNMRPRFTDEPREAVVVPINTIGRKPKDTEEE